MPGSDSQSGTGTEAASQSPPPSSHGSESHVGSGPKPGSSSDAVQAEGADGAEDADGSGAGSGCGWLTTGCATGCGAAGAIEGTGAVGFSASAGCRGDGEEGRGSAASRSCWLAAGAPELAAAVRWNDADSAGPLVTAGSGRRSTFGPAPPAGAEPPSAMTNSMFTPSTFWMHWPRIATLSCRPVNAVMAPECAKLTVSVRPSNPVMEAFGATIAQTNFLLFFSSSRMSGQARRNISTDPVPPEAAPDPWLCCCAAGGCCCCPCCC